MTSIVPTLLNPRLVAVILNIFVYHFATDDAHANVSLPARLLVEFLQLSALASLFTSSIQPRHALVWSIGVAPSLTIMLCTTDTASLVYPLVWVALILAAQDVFICLLVTVAASAVSTVAAAALASSSQSPPSSSAGSWWFHGSMVCLTLLAVCGKSAELRHARARIQISAKQLEQASVAKTQFLANISHEIRTPMNAVLGMLSVLLLSATDADADAASSLEAAQSAARHLMDMLDQMLDVSQFELGKMEIPRQEFDLKAVALEAVGLVRPQIQSKGLSLVVDCADVTALGDAQRASQVSE